MKDLNGRSYLTVAEAKPGVEIEVDGDFDCIAEGSKVTLDIDEHGLYFKCAEDHHDLVGQLAHSHFIGLYPTKSEK